MERRTQAAAYAARVFGDDHAHGTHSLSHGGTTPPAPLEAC
jgi:hypothetical protein